MAIDFSRFEAVTFDCYGTLIDWERGIVRAFREMVGGAGSEVPEREILERFATLEAEAEQGPYRSYREILTDVALGLSGRPGVVPDQGRAAAFAASVPDWPPFEDSVAAL